MKKKSLVLSMMIMTLLVTSCGIVKSSIDVKYDVDDYVTLAKDYKKLPVNIEGDYTVNDESEKNYLDKIISSVAPYDVDNSKNIVGKDSIVEVDYVGKVDKKEFAGGKADGVLINVSTNTDAKRGSSYIEGFSKDLIGKKKGDTVTTNVVFPKNYTEKKLAGKNAEFTFKIKNIMKKVTIDTLNDEYTKKNFKIDNVTAFKNTAKKALQANLRAAKAKEVRQNVIKELTKNSKIKFPKKVLEMRKSEFTERLKKNAKIKDDKAFKKYIKENLKMDEKKFNEVAIKNIKESLKTELVCEAIVKKEKIKLDKKEYTNFINGLKQGERIQKDKDLFEKYGVDEKSGEKYLKKMYLATKAIAFVQDHAVVTVKPKPQAK